MQSLVSGDDGDGGDAVSFSVAPLYGRDSALEAREVSAATEGGAGAWEGSVVLSLRVESKPRTDCGGAWERVREDLVALQDVNLVTKLDRANYAYRISLWPASPSDEWDVTFPFYLRAPMSSSEDKMQDHVAPPHIGTFAIGRRVEECTSTLNDNVEDRSQHQAAGFLCGTLVLALLVRVLLSHAGTQGQRTRRGRSISSSAGECALPHGKRQRTSKESEPQATTPTQKSARPEEATGFASTDTDGEMLMEAFPEFNDDRGWRDFFDSHIYRPKKDYTSDESSEDRESRSRSRRTGTISPTALKSRQRYKRHLEGVRLFPSGKETEREMRQRIDRESMEAAIDDAECFFEFWQM